MFQIPVRASVLVIALSAAQAQTVEVVRPGGGLSFPDIQQAVDAAADGDSLLVTEGSYGPFTVDAKSLSIFAVPGAHVEVGETVVVKNLAAHQRVVLSGLVVETPATGAARSAVRLIDNEGPVRLQDCWLGQDHWWQGALGWDCSLGSPPDAQPAVVASNCRRLALVDCELFGNPGEWADSYWAFCDAGAGGAGLEVVASDVALYGCTVVGGIGGSTTYSGTGTGGPGVVAADSTIFASGGSVRGGAGGIDWIGGPSGPGGDGAQLSARSELTALDCPVQAAHSGSPPGQAVTGAGRFVPMDGSARTVAAATVAPSDVALQVSYSGVLGDLVWLPTSSMTGHRVLLGLHGVWLTRFPAIPPFLPHGRVGATGGLVVPLDLPRIPAGGSHAMFTVQGLSVGPPFSSIIGALGLPGPLPDRTPLGLWLDRRLASARHVLALDPAQGPDCNANGVSDYLDVILGTSLDTNHDLRPDECGR